VFELLNLTSLQTEYALLTLSSDGTLSDPSGNLFVKPCTAAEISFYESANASHPDLTAFMPPFMGTLSLKQQNPSSPNSEPSMSTAGTGTASSLPPTDVGPMKGKPLNTELHLVLGNSTAGFVKPNILDLKLGARLWDDDAPPAKRARLDAVADKSTSGSLGFRIAGMRTWMGQEQASVAEAEKGFVDIETPSNFKVHNKLYGRNFDAQTVVDGFRSYLCRPEAGIDMPVSAGLAGAFLDGLTQVCKVLENKELRMYSASILMVYEGDGQALREKQAMQEEGTAELPENDEDDDDDSDHLESPKILTVKLIDFAHAKFVPGEGPDENALRGVRSVIKILQELHDEFQN
jgi:1D-myo-inositol-tetrakisphosphate 5-kinase/inositol-polyphosphate multikinase